MNKMLLMLGASIPLAGCQTASFAPPAVNPQQIAHVGGETGCAARVPADGTKDVSPDVEGALALTNNFIFAYRCAERELANGRQYFQLPAFAAAAVGLVGPTLGLGADGALIAGSTAGMFNTGHSYYAPRDKLAMVSAATRAVICIKTEAVGVGYFELVAKGDEDGGGGGEAGAQEVADVSLQLGTLARDLAAKTRELEARAATDPGAAQELRENRELERRVRKALVDSSVVAAAASVENDSVYISAERQYFEMVSGALFSVETILAERLRDAGSADTKAIFDQLTKLAEEHAAAVKKLKEAKAAAKGGGNNGGNEGGGGEAGTEEFVSYEDVPPEAAPKLIELENEVLRPKLQTCVLQARAS